MKITKTSSDESCRDKTRNVYEEANRFPFWITKEKRCFSKHEDIHYRPRRFAGGAVALYRCVTIALELNRVCLRVGIHTAGECHHKGQTETLGNTDWSHCDYKWHWSHISDWTYRWNGVNISILWIYLYQHLFNFHFVRWVHKEILVSIKNLFYAL